MNWKENNYKIGEKALLVFKHVLENNNKLPTIEEVEITYVGTKILKIKRRKGEIIEFKDKSQKSGIFGLFYLIYKDKNEYEKDIKDKERRRKLIGKIEGKISTLSLEQLILINRIIYKESDV